MHLHVNGWYFKCVVVQSFKCFMKFMYHEYEIFCSNADKRHGTKGKGMEIREVGGNILLNISINFAFR